jgi:hypothetical protein
MIDFCMKGHVLTKCTCHVPKAKIKRTFKPLIAQTLKLRAQERCLYGHPLSGPNVYKYKNKRMCRECRSRRVRDWFLANYIPKTSRKKGVRRVTSKLSERILERQTGPRTNGK